MNYLKLRTSIFLCIELALYLSFLYLDLQNNNIQGIRPEATNILKYLSLFLCFLYSLSESILGHYISYFTIALAFAATADIFLLFTPYFGIGIFFFICVQSCYRYILSGKKGVLEMYLISMIITIGTLGIMKLFQLAPYFMVVPAAFYFGCLSCNVIKTCLEAISSKQISLKNYLYLFAVGIILLFLCDVNVGLYNSSNFLSIKPDTFMVSILNFSSIGMWLFYLPSQIIITLLSLKNGHFSSYISNKGQGC